MPAPILAAFAAAGASALGSQVGGAVGRSIVGDGQKPQFEPPELPISNRLGNRRFMFDSGTVSAGSPVTRAFAEGASQLVSSKLSPTDVLEQSIRNRLPNRGELEFDPSAGFTRGSRLQNVGLFPFGR